MRSSQRYLFELRACIEGIITSAGQHAIHHDPDAPTCRFDHGVASGDPLSDRLVIWTRVTPFATSSVRVSWQVAHDEAFRSIVNQDQAVVDADHDYTVKVDVCGLKPDTVYYYRFRVGDTYSPPGRTRTLPVGSVDRIGLAVLTCADHESGFTEIDETLSGKSEIDAVLHLGNYLKHVRRDTARRPLTGATATSDDRYNALEAHRARYAKFRSDPYLQSLHARLPFIFAWDPQATLHGARRTDTACRSDVMEYPFFSNRLAEVQAHHEWLPLRPRQPDCEGRIYRRFEFGNLLNLISLDTGINARDGWFENDHGVDTRPGDPDGDGYEYDTGSRTLSLPGTQQRSWLSDTVNRSPAAWQLLEQRDLVASVLPAVTVTSGFPAISRSEYRDIADAAITFQKLVTEGYDGDDPAALMSAGLTAKQLAIVNDPVKMGYLDASHISYELEACNEYSRDRTLLHIKAGRKNLISLISKNHDHHPEELTASGQHADIPREEHLILNNSPYGQVCERRSSHVEYSVSNRHARRKRGVMFVELTPNDALVEWRFAGGDDERSRPFVSDRGGTQTIVVDSRESA